MDCPNCGHRTFSTELVRIETTGATSFLVTESRKECPACGTRLHIFVPHTAPGLQLTWHLQKGR